MNIRIVTPLRHRNFRTLLASSVVSNIGDWLDLVALLVLVSVVWDLGAPGLATVSVAASLPVLLAPFIGVLVDRIPARRVMVTADIARALLTLGLVMAGSIWVVAAIVVVRATFGTAFNSAAQVLIRRSVPADALVSANSLNQVVIQAVKIAGPALGGVLVAVTDPHTVFAVNAVSFLVSAAFLLLLRSTSAPASIGGRGPRSYLRELTEGLRFVATSRVLTVTALTMTVLMFVVFLYDSMSPLAVLGLGLDERYVGYMIAAVGLGGVLGALAVSQRFRGRRPFAVMGVSVAVIGVVIALVGVGLLTGVRLGPWPWLGAIFVLGMASAGVLVPYPVIIQTETPERLMGRVWTIMGTIPGALAVLAPAAGAALVTWIGVGRVFALAGVALAAYGLFVVAALVRVRPAGLDDTADTADTADTDTADAADTAESAIPYAPVPEAVAVVDSASGRR